jgi:hypothetical protein
MGACRATRVTPDGVGSGRRACGRARRPHRLAGQHGLPHAGEQHHDHGQQGDELDTRLAAFVSE